MRANREGTIQKLPSGKYRAAVTLNGKRWWGPSVQRKREALPALWQWLTTKLKQSEEAEPSLSICVQQRIERMTSESYSPTTVELWKFALKKIDGAAIGAMPPSEITAHDITAWRSSLTGAARTRNNYAAVVVQVLRDRGFTPKIKKLASDSPEKKALTPEEETRLANAELPLRKWLMVHLGLYCGLRREEIAGLRHEDAEDGGFWINRAVVQTAGTISIKAPKNANSRAWNALPHWLIPYIGSGQGYVLGDGERPISPSTLNHWWTEIANDLDLKGIGLHGLRRTYAMMLLETQSDVKTASSMLRHDPVMLLNVYAKTRRDLKKAAIGRATINKGVAQPVAEIPKTRQIGT